MHCSQKSVWISHLWGVINQIDLVSFPVCGTIHMQVTISSQVFIIQSWFCLTMWTECELSLSLISLAPKRLASNCRRLNLPCGFASASWPSEKGVKAVMGVKAARRGSVHASYVNPEMQEWQPAGTHRAGVNSTHGERLLLCAHFTDWHPQAELRSARIETELLSQQVPSI